MTSIPQHHVEPARQTPIVEHVDVLVAGGGPAGVAAALAAARGGAEVRLIESQGQVGGVWTSGMLSWVIDSGNKGGVMADIFARLDQARARQPLHQGGVAYDIDKMKLTLEQACVEAGVKLRLHTRVVAAGRDEDDRLRVAVTESKSGREAFAAKVFIDASGDGDFAAQAGCGYDLGRPARGPGSRDEASAGQTQPMSLMGLIAGLSQNELLALGVVRGENVTKRFAKDRLGQVLKDLDVEPSYGDPTLFPIRDGLHGLMANHEYGVSALSAQEITDATLRGRAEVHHIVDRLRSQGGPWAGGYLVATASQIGVREARRIHGRYTLTVDDIMRGARFEDAVCRVTFGIDVHSTDRAKTAAVEKDPVQKHAKTQPYDIPYRALVARDCDGLLLAGRCISGDFLAHSSYRVTGNAVAMGESAGLAAAAAANRDCLPHELDFRRDVVELG